MSDDVIIAQAARILPDRSSDIAPVQVVGDVSKVGAYFDLAQHMDPAVVIVLISEISNDGGATWRFNGLSTHPGVPASEQQGPLAGHEFGYTDANGKPVINKSPLVRTAIYVSGGTLDAGITVIAK